VNLGELRETRRVALDINRNSKWRMTRSDRILRGEWNKVWPDLSVTQSEPAVENVYLEAAEDKSATAASILPIFDVPPRRGTRLDRAERSGEQASRVFTTLAQNSRLDAHHVGFYLDWFVYGMPAAMAWKDWDDPQGMPYLERLAPRHVFPVSWNSKGQLAEGLLIRKQRFADIVREFGAGNPGLQQVATTMKGRIEPQYEVIWWANETHWSIALAHEELVTSGDADYIRPSEIGQTNVAVAWLKPPSEHRMNGCPILVSKAVSADGEIRGKLDAMLPPLKIAHGLQIELMLNLRRSMHAPPVVQNIENWQKFGPDVVMRGVRGPEKAVIDYPRPPIDFAAFTHIDEQLRAARNAGHFPQQRGGEPGASIASGEAVQLLQGGYNAQQSWAQTDMARFYTDAFGRLASLDEQWSYEDPVNKLRPVERKIDGFDAGEAYTDDYTPAEFWKGDYRVLVSYPALGVDSHTNLLNLGAAHRLEWLPKRMAMQRSGMVPNAIAAEREMSLDKAVRLFEDGVLPAMVAQGSTAQLLEYVEMLDGDKETTRTAMQKILKGTEEQAAQSAEAPPPQVTPELLSLVQ